MGADHQQAGTDTSTNESTITRDIKRAVSVGSGHTTALLPHQIVKNVGARPPFTNTKPERPAKLLSQVEDGQ